MPWINQQVFVDENGNPTTPPQAQTDSAQPISSPDQVDLGNGATGAPQPNVTPGGPQAQVSPSPSPTPTPVLGGFTPPQPSVSPPAQTPVVKTGSSYSQGESGFSGNRYSQVDKTSGGVDAQIARAKQQADAAYHNEAQAAVIANMGQQEAVAGEANVLSQQEAAKADLYRQEAQMQSMFAAAESTAADLARDRTVAYRMRFEQTAAQAAAMQVNPGLKLSAGQGIGLAMSLFAQGYLGAAGIQTADVRGMVGQMIDRNIDLQMQQIRQGHQLAADQQQLWQMARSEASDDAEARLRLRGLMLAQAETAMQSEMAKYGSKLAAAKGLTAAADLRAELNKTLGELTDRYFRQYQAQSNLALDEWKTKINASMESRRIGLAQQQLNLERDKLKAQTQKMPNIIWDTTKSGGGQAKWVFLDGVPPEKQFEVRQQAGASANLVDRLKQYEELSKEAGEVYGGWGKAMLNDKFSAQVDAWRNGLILDISLAKTGKQSNETEIKRIDSQIPLNSWTMRDGEEKVRLIINDQVKQAIKSADQAIGSTAYTIPEAMRDQFPRAGINQYGRGELTEANVRGQPDVTPNNDFFSRRSEEARSPGADLEHSSINDRPGSSQWQEFVRSHDKAGTLDYIEPDLRKGPSPAYDAGIKLLKGIEPGYAKAMDWIAGGLTSPEADKQLRAAETLKALAEDPAQSYRSYYAGYLLDKAGIQYRQGGEAPATSDYAPVESFSTEAPRKK